MLLVLNNFVNIDDGQYQSSEI